MNPATLEAGYSSSKTRSATSAGLATVALMVLGIILPACRSQTPGDTAQAANHAVIKTVTIPIEGMSCSACAARVKRTLKGIDGVVETEINLERRNVRVRYVEGKISPERLVAAIHQLGYKVGIPRTAGNTKPAGATSANNAVLIPITGMSCEQMCVPKVKRALEALDGVTQVEVSLKQGNAHVQYLAGKISPEKMVAVIHALGFKAGSPQGSRN